MPLVIKDIDSKIQSVVDAFAAYVADKEDYTLHHITDGYELRCGRRWVSINPHPYLQKQIELTCLDLDNKWGTEIRLPYHPVDDINVIIESIYKWFTLVAGPLFIRRSGGTDGNRMIYRWGDIVSYLNEAPKHNN